MSTIRNRKVYLRLAEDLRDFLAESWGRARSRVSDHLDDCGVVFVRSPGHVWDVEFTLYPHHRTVRVQLIASIGGKAWRVWDGQAVLRKKPAVVDVLELTGLTEERRAWASSQLLESTGISAVLDVPLYREVSRA